MNLCNLKVRAVGVMSEFAHLTVCDGFLEDIAKGYEYLDRTLPAGLYCITLKLDGHIIKRNIRLDTDMEEILTTPPVYSSLPAKGFESSHTYYMENAVRYSKEPTFGDKGGSLFLFFRYSDSICSKDFNKERKSMGDGFSLLDKDHQLLCYLDAASVKEDLYNGWMAFNGMLPAGTYYLRYQDIREIPLQVFGDAWQTQVFLTFGNAPIFPSMGIIISPMEKGFIPDDESNYQIDGMRHKLHNGVYYIPEKALQEFEAGIFTSPMKGLLAAHVYFNTPEVENDALFVSVIPNLAAVLGADTPDIKALRVLAAQYFKEPVPNVEISEPGMFLAGTKAVIQASLLSNNNIYGDMIWTSNALTGKTSPDSILSIVKQLLVSESTAEAIGDKLLSSQPLNTLLYYINNLEDVNELAAKLKTTPDMVNKTMRYIRSISNPQKTHELFTTHWIKRRRPSEL